MDTNRICTEYESTLDFILCFYCTGHTFENLLSQAKSKQKNKNSLESLCPRVCQSHCKDFFKYLFHIVLIFSLLCFWIYACYFL